MNSVLTDAQWDELKAMFPNPEKRGRGKPHTPWRHVVNSILWVLSSGENWDALPKAPHFASKSASNRWYKVWRTNGLLDQMMAKLPEMSVLVVPKFPRTRVRGKKVREEQMLVEPVALSM